LSIFPGVGTFRNKKRVKAAHPPKKEKKTREAKGERERQMAPADRFSRRLSKVLLSYDKGEATSWTMSHGDKVARLERVARCAASRIPIYENVSTRRNL
jgi:hypothetical protein